MSAVITEGPMVKRNDVSVKLDAEVAKQAKLVSDFKGLTLAEYISDVLKGIVDRDLAEHAEKFLESRKAKKPKGKGGGEASN